MKKLAIVCLLAGAAVHLPASAVDTPDPHHGGTIVLKRTNYPTLPEPAGPYSLSVRHNNTLYLSGMTAFGTPAQGKSMVQQTEAIFEQMKRVTQAEGIGMRDLIKVTVFVTSMDEIGGLRDVLTKHYDGAYPASSLLKVAGLFSPEVNIEIEAVFATAG
ncbi:2-iminobutanoate/2-iminopropanoate deaminase [Pseudomonas nitritireducens]|uniref:2-iminobutanoate/2-iminopropanoate deaminase n=1 Tax=Pseudomonas nitroreducens TaxID=46680 RepID=A0A7W7KTH9_PSENT|nr:RidA family protein [Pseudomonas nitritireducens]MBB4868230.1 2-iminobutanoate/2-iminopropanoate deaminase [Pseudomonas nitritireducens]